MNRCLYFLVLSALCFYSCSDYDYAPGASPNPQQLTSEPLARDDVDAFIRHYLDTGQVFQWILADDRLLWSAGVSGDDLYTVGFGNSAADLSRENQVSPVLESELLQLIADSEALPIASLEFRKAPFLNQFDVRIRKFETILKLRRRTGVRYLEPAAYVYQEGIPPPSGSSSGCDLDSETMATVDFSTTSPNAKIPWSFSVQQIPQAWTLGTGSGVTVGIIDTGVSASQPLLGSSFSSGYSFNRTISRLGFYVDSIWPWSTTTDGFADQCGHGTSTASVLAAPRNSQGVPVGVAYNCNLVACRAAANVVLDGYHEQNGVRDAFTYLANQSSVRIISMSMGHVISVSKIKDAVKYAYSKNKLIFCAAGTSTSFTNFVGVIFPASMDEVVAVTGVKESLPLQECTNCHEGDKVEFALPMERLSGNSVPVNGYFTNTTDYIGGSSVATAMTAGIAAIVWGRFPGWSRTQVLNRLRLSSDNYPYPDVDLGYGFINVWEAVQ